MKHLILALLAVGCSHTPTGTAAVREGAPHESFVVEGNEHLYVDTIIAIDEWNAVCPNVHLTVSQEPEADAVQVYVDPTLDKQYAGEADADLDINWRDVRVQPSLVAMRRVDVLKHEIGHQLGLGHTPGTTGLMSPKMNPDMAVTPALCAMIPEKK